ncbi:FtsX-like permease family protein [Candidatus Peribacteria bacterium]|nr:FtsX-like permease family protein [Candidatus Peribacteria bacterium]
MLIQDTFRSALKGIAVNKNRSMLTMLGIIIGVGSVVLMSSVGQSMQGVILGQISSLGPKSMVIFPGQDNGGPNGVSTGFDSFTFEDLRELEQLKTITNIAPVIFITGTVSYGREEGAPQVFGVRPNFFQNQSIAPRSGRLLDSEDNDGAKAVAVLAPDVVEKYFGSIEPLGKRIKIGDRHYTVIGTTNALGSQFFQNADNRIYVPFNVARDVTGQKYLNYATMQSTEGFDLAFDDVKTLMRRRHGIDNPKDDPKKDDFIVRSSAQAGEILGSVSLGLTLFITTIAAISLLVGGIGIMNIMLVSVTERTGEIGLRKALGAKRRDILLQFLTESVLLTMIGGAIGVIGGIFIAFLIAGIAKYFLTTYFFAVSIRSIIAAFVMAAFTGVAFGISPARHAAGLHPIEALRYE